ncbi:membrane protein, partial [Streptomyces sp. NRRL S-444]
MAVLRVRSRATALGLLPAALAVVLLSARMTGRLAGDPWPVVTLVVCVVAVLVLLVGGAFAAVVLRASPAVTPTVPLPETAAPDLYRLVRDLADRMDVPAPSAIALTPDCDSWLEDRTHAAHRRGGISGGRESQPGA